MMRSSSNEELLEKLREICRPLPGAEEYTMVHHPAFRVRKRPFAVVGLGSREEAMLSINHGYLEQAEFLEDERFIRTPYMGRNGWVSLAAKSTDLEEIKELVIGSYRRVAGKKLLAQLGGE